MERRSLLITLAMPMLAWAQGKGKGKGQGNQGQGNQGQGNQGSRGGNGQGRSGGNVNIVFSTNDRSAIWDYYGANPNWIPPASRSLPPGLAKNLQRGKPLPPGWQKKMAGFPMDLDGRLGPLPGGYRRVLVDRWAFVIATATNTIMDIIDLVRN